MGCRRGGYFVVESVTESVTSTQAEQRAPLGYLTCETLFQGVWITRHAKTELEKLATRAHGAVTQTGNTLVASALVDYHGLERVLLALYLVNELVAGLGIVPLQP